MKILNVLWINDIGIITVDRGYEVKTYIGKCFGQDEKSDIEFIINTCPRIYPEQLERIVNLHKKAAKQGRAGVAK